MMKTTAFLFYDSLYQTINLFDEQQRGKIVLNVIEYGIMGEMKNCPQRIKTALQMHLNSIDIQKNRYMLKKILQQCKDDLEKIIGVAEKNSKLMSYLQMQISNVDKAIKNAKKRDIINLDEIAKLWINPNILKTATVEVKKMINVELGLDPYDSISKEYHQYSLKTLGEYLLSKGVEK